MRHARKHHIRPKNWYALRQTTHPERLLNIPLNHLRHGNIIEWWCATYDATFSRA